MQIKISKSALSEALNNVQAAVGAKNTLQVLQNVKMSARDGKVKLTCSDLDVTIQAKADCEVSKAGETTIPVKIFASAVGKLAEGDILFSVDADDKAKLSAGTSVFKFNGMSAKEFPTLPTAEGKSCKLSVAAVREMLRKTAFAMCMDETRVRLNGVLLEFKDGGKISVVATDGRRLALLECTVDGASDFKGQFILPRKAVDVLVKKLPKDGDVEIVSSKSQLSFKTAKIDITTKLIEDAYPAYLQVIPKTVNHVISVDRVELLGAIDRISVFASADTPCVRLTFGDNKCVLNSDDTEFGAATDEVPIKFDAEQIEMRFNPQFIRDVLNVLDEEQIEIKLIGSGAPAVFRRGDDDYTYVVMPLRV